MLGLLTVLSQALQNAGHSVAEHTLVCFVALDVFLEALKGEQFSKGFFLLLPVTLGAGLVSLQLLQ